MANYPDPSQFGGKVKSQAPDPSQFGGRVVEKAPQLDPHQQMIDEMGTGERLLVGVGRGMVSTFQGLKQAYLHAFGSPEETAAYDDHVNQEKAQFDKLGDQSLAASIGNIGGQVAATVPVAMLPGGQATLAPRLASLGAQGGMAAMTQPAEGGEGFIGQKLEQGATGAAFGAGAGAAIAGVGKVAETVFPPNVAGRVLNWRQAKNMQTPHAQEGLEIARKTGIDLSPGAVSGSSAVTHAENAARQSFFTSDAVREVDHKIANQTIGYINKVMNRLSPGAKSAETVGDTVRDAIRSGVARLGHLREQSAKQDYGLVRQLAGRQPVIRFESAVAEAKRIAAEYKDVPGADAAKIRSQVGDLIEKLGGTRNTGILGPDGKPIVQEVIKTLDIDHAMRTRRFYSKASAGTGNVFDDVSPNLNRDLAARLARAIEGDFEGAANRGQGAMYEAFKQANANYRRYSQSIEYIEKSALGRLLGDELTDAAITGRIGYTVPAEKIANRLLTLSPSEMKVARDLLMQANPQALAASKRYVIEQALQKGMDIAPSAGAAAVPLAGNKFINALLPDENMRAMFSPKELGEITLAVNAIKRWGDKTGYNFSGTAPMNEFMGTVNSAGESIGSLSWKTLAKVLTGTSGKVIGLRQVAHAMSDPIGRRHLIDIARFGPKSRKAANALAYLTAITGSQDAGGAGHQANGAGGQ